MQIGTDKGVLAFVAQIASKDEVRRSVDLQRERGSQRIRQLGNQFSPPQGGNAAGFLLALSFS
jgi:hypothetical protein